MHVHACIILTILGTFRYACDLNLDVTFLTRKQSGCGIKERPRPGLVDFGGARAAASDGIVRGSCNKWNPGARLATGSRPSSTGEGTEEQRVL